ncbi:hypothetical protein [Agromyces sp. ZXT2-6]|uniref:hypothetical protein n=1 Tax=Agromyces sp. ZXT2-6 TaxID=3461153 RepID=UPI004054B96A
MEPGAQLPQVVLRGSAPRGCDASMVIGGVVDGALVTIDRVSEGLSESAAFDLESLTYVLSSPLDSGGGELTVVQSLIGGCEVEASEPVGVRFGPAQAPGRPALQPPCEGSPFLWVEGLRGGADIEIEADGTVFHARVAPGGNAQRFDVTGLRAGATVSVTQSMCGLVSEPGTVTVGPRPAGADHRPVGPLFACARVVRVVGVTPGALVRVAARGALGEYFLSPWVWSPTDRIAVEVTPGLVEGDVVFAVQVACGGGPSRSVSDEPVEPLPDVQPPEIAFGFSSRRSVTVVALPGALVRVFRRRDGAEEEIGRGLVDPEHDRVPVGEPLEEGEELFATQEICDIRSEHGPEYRVRPGQRVFSMGAPKVRPVTSEPPGHDITWFEGRLQCSIDGESRFVGRFRNTAENSTADIHAGVTIRHPSGFRFGVSGDVFLTAENDDHPTNKLWMAKGYRPDGEISIKRPQPAWRDPAQWSIVLDSQATFEWVQALSTFPESEADDGEEDDEKAPNPPPSN